MEERELRLKCLEIAEHSMPSEYTDTIELISRAHVLYLYVVNGTVPDGKTVTPATGIAEGQGGAG